MDPLIKSKRPRQSVSKCQSIVRVNPSVPRSERCSVRCAKAFDDDGMKPGARPGLVERRSELYGGIVLGIFLAGRYAPEQQPEIETRPPFKSLH